VGCGEIARFSLPGLGGTGIVLAVPGSSLMKFRSTMIVDPTPYRPCVRYTGVDVDTG
jgi:hypothetical protein